MAKRKRATTTLDQPSVMAFLELRMAVMQHCQALKSVIDMLAKDQKQNAVARLDQAVAALGAVVRGQAVGVTMACPSCESAQDVTAWVDRHECGACGAPLNWPDESDK